MPASKAQQKAVHKYTKENYDRFLISMKPKGRLETVKAHAEMQGESANGFINRAIQEAIERDTGAAGGPQGARVVSLPSETVKAAQEAAKAAGEGVPQFIGRAVTIQAQRDRTSLKLGINPATGEKLKGEA